MAWGFQESRRGWPTSSSEVRRHRACTIHAFQRPAGPLEPVSENTVDEMEALQKDYGFTNWVCGRGLLRTLREGRARAEAIARKS